MPISTNAREFAALEVTGSSTARITSATIEIQGGTNGEDTLLVDSTNEITGVFAGSTLTLTGSASLADYQAVLRTVRYSNSSNNPSADDRTLNISLVPESTGDPVLASRLLQINPIDDPLQLTLPNAFGVITDPIRFAAGSAISFMPEDADPDSAVTY